MIALQQVGNNFLRGAYQLQTIMARDTVVRRSIQDNITRIIFEISNTFFIDFNNSNTLLTRPEALCFLSYCRHILPEGVYVKLPPVAKYDKKKTIEYFKHSNKMKEHAGIPGEGDVQHKETLREEMERFTNCNSNFTYIKALDGSPGWDFFQPLVDDQQNDISKLLVLPRLLFEGKIKERFRIGSKNLYSKFGEYLSLVDEKFLTPDLG
jgi:hypothetical protein